MPPHSLVTPARVAARRRRPCGGMQAAAEGSCGGILSPAAPMPVYRTRCSQCDASTYHRVKLVPPRGLPLDTVAALMYAVL